MTHPPSFECGGLLRRVRREADLSQRELAEASGMSRSRICQLENGQADLRLAELVTVAALIGARVALLRADGTEVDPMTPDAVTDRARRRFPAHLDVRHGDEGWWADEVRYTRTRPRYTFDRTRAWRDGARRARGVPADHPEPQLGDSLLERAQARADARARAAAAERQRRFLAGELGRTPPEPECACPPACDELLVAGARHPHVEDCPCRCDLD